MATGHFFSLPSAIGNQGIVVSPQISSKLRHIFDDTGLTLSSSYQTVYTYSGSGLFVGIGIDHQDDDTTYKLTIDSDVIFELKVENVSLVTHNDLSNWPYFAPVSDTNGKQLFYYPLYPIQYSSLVKLEAKESGGSDIYRYLVSLTKET